MKFGHLPAGYIASKLLFKSFKKRTISYNSFIFLGLLGAVAPDFDLIYMAVVEDYQYDHHKYFTHLPVFWLGLLLISVVWLSLSNNLDKNPSLAFIFCFNGFIHMILDTFTGPVFWLAPHHNNTAYSFLLNDVTYGSMDLNYFANWSFVVELFIIWWAIYLHFNKYLKSGR